MGTEMDNERSIRPDLAGEVLSQKLSRAKSEAFAIVLIEIAAAVPTGVDAQGKGTNGSFVCTLGQWSDG